MDEKMMKVKRFEVAKADAQADIRLINQYSLKELSPEEVYCFSLVLCDNEIDRDLERFSDRSLKKLAKLFVGKPGVKDHSWSTNNQVSRLYRAEVEETGKQTKDGRPLLRLRGNAYMLNNETNKPLIENIDAGIVKEISVGVGMKACNCSVCGKALRFSWQAGNYQCENEHTKGLTYNGQLCHGVLDEPVDAYEFSFVAVPAQPGAGTTKGLTMASAHETLLKMPVEELAQMPEANEALIKHLKMAQLSAEERQKRAELIKMYSKKNEELRRKIK